MEYRGALITGVSGAGKTTISVELQRRDRLFRQIVAVTTRAHRPDDISGTYQYLVDRDFDLLEDSGALIIRAEYRGRRYGITRAHLDGVVQQGQIPLMVVTPESANDFINDKNKNEMGILSIFIDAPDPVLDERLISRGGKFDQRPVNVQRQVDRRYRDSCALVIQNLDLQNTVSLIISNLEIKHSTLSQ